ncbi:MAG: hypothetical protein ACI9UA_000488 [Pseudoalteromonas tetraodonis]
MTLTRLRPFGQRRKTYFYGVAGFVLAAHVVVGGIIYVMPPALDEIAPPAVGVEMQIVEHLLADDAIETGEVELIETVETPPDPEVGQGDLAEPEFVEGSEPLNFDPVGQPQGEAPDTEPIGPTATELSALIIDHDEEEIARELEAEKAARELTLSPQEETAAASVPELKSEATGSSSSTRSESTKPKTSTTRRTVSRSVPKTKLQPQPAPQPVLVPVPVPKAIPTNRAPERKGLLDKLRNRRDRS